MLLLRVPVFSLAVGGLCSSLPRNQFETLSYEAIVDQLHDLATSYPHLAQVYSAQERYQLSSPGRCSKDGSVMCQQWVLHISDHTTLDTDPERPEVFFSGCIHGDEQVGPTAVMEASKLMVYAAVCHDDSTSKECDDEVLRAAPEMVPWLARLALTRSTVIMPMTNSIGYYNTVRMENRLDPNRDFPYHQEPDKCMTTITARAVNEVWREHVFQLAVTFHGGMVGMAYEWGSPDHPHIKDKHGNWQDISPDHTAQEVLTAGLSHFAGGFKEGGANYEAYPTGRMNELVYPVSGGMEDWAYAGSWGDAMVVCEPTDNGGYPKEKTMYNSAMLRALNILVEASDSKHPPQSQLGSRKSLLDYVSSREEHNNGHVARNIRLALMLVDLVEPYVQWVPSEVQVQEEEEVGSDAKVVFTDDKDGVDLEWTVGGAFEVDTSQLVWGRWPEQSGTLTRGDWEELAAAASAEDRSPAQSGRSRWTKNEGEEGEGATVFRARFDLGKLSPLSENDNGVVAAFVVAVTTVDQAWGAQTVQGWPDVGPQSHYVNARTSEDWFQENEGHIVRGRLQWLSAPLKVVAPSPSSKASAAKLPESTVKGTADSETKGGGNGELGIRGGNRGGGYGDGTVPPFDWLSPPGSAKEGRMMKMTAVMSAGLVLAGLLVCGLVVRVVRRARGEGRAFGSDGGGAGATRRLRGRVERGTAQGPVQNEMGGVQLGVRGPASVFSRRRNKDLSLDRVGGGSTTASPSASLERSGLLSPVDDETR